MILLWPMYFIKLILCQLFSPQMWTFLSDQATVKIKNILSLKLFPESESFLPELQCCPHWNSKAQIISNFPSSFSSGCGVIHAFLLHEFPRKYFPRLVTKMHTWPTEGWTISDVQKECRRELSFHLHFVFSFCSYYFEITVFSFRNSR